MGKPTKTATSDIGSVGLQRGQTVADRDAGGGVFDLLRRGLGSSGDRSGTPSDTPRVAQYDIQTITPDGTTAVAGSPVAIPSGWWLASASVYGNWDDIFGGYISDDVTPVGGWIAHRPSDRPGEVASGSVSSSPVDGGTLTPVVGVDGSGEGVVRIITRFDPCEAPS